MNEETLEELESMGDELENTIGMYGKREEITVDHQTRAASNRYSHLALEAERAYHTISQDVNDSPLSCSKCYTFTMPTDVPFHRECGGFWPFTVYLTDTKQFVPNEEKCYRISDSNGTLTDGTFKITIGGKQEDAIEPDN